MTATLEQRIDAVLEAFADGDRSDAILAEMSDLMRDPRTPIYLTQQERMLEGKLDGAKTSLAAVAAKLTAVALLAFATPDEQPTPNFRFSRNGGPVTEIQMMALTLLRAAGGIVPLDLSDGPLEEARDPDFSDMRRVFGSAVQHLATAAYFLLDASDARDALLSSPPAQETFPPLPFPRVWIEMAHLTPMLRMVDREPRHDVQGHHQRLDVLGVGIAEVEQCRVWDVYLPVLFDDRSEFTILAGRIAAPGQIVSADPALEAAVVAFAFAKIRDLAVGAVHLVTARNAPPEDVALPRHQRKRLPARPASSPFRLYYVDLHSAGESAGSGGGSREYHVRWLVRGHWRHVDAGRSFCTCCDTPQVASWVAPYIKGPAGAPWKGKQVRR